MIYLLNSPVLTSYGQWDFRGPLTITEARHTLSDGFISAIGHDSSARYLALLLDMDIRANRIRADLKPGDHAIVLRILERIPEGIILDDEALQRVPCELSLLSKLT